MVVEVVVSYGDSCYHYIAGNTQENCLNTQIFLLKLCGPEEIGQSVLRRRDKSQAHEDHDPRP